MRWRLLLAYAWRVCLAVSAAVTLVTFAAAQYDATPAAALSGAARHASDGGGGERLR